MSDQFDELNLGSVEFEDPEIEEGSLEGDDRTVTIRTSGHSEVIPWNEGITLQEAFDATNLLMRARTDFYLDNATIEMGTVLPAGAVVTAIGATVKGG